MTGYHCSFCDHGFDWAGEGTPHTVPLEADGGSILVGYVCPDCWQEHAAEIAEGLAAYARWEAGEDPGEEWR